MHWLCLICTFNFEEKWQISFWNIASNTLLQWNAEINRQIFLIHVRLPFQLDKQDINYHLVKAQELRKLKTLRKKWFVLYEDPDSPIDPDRKRVDHRKTRRRRTEIEQGEYRDSAFDLSLMFCFLLTFT